MPPKQSFFNPIIFGRQLFPTAERTGELARSAINAVAPIAGAITSVGSRFTNPIQSILSDVGALRSAVAGTPLVGRSRMADASAPSVAQLPSGTMMTGADIYPTTPQMAPSFSPTPTRSGSVTTQPIASQQAVPQFPNIGMGIMGNQNIKPLPTEQISPMTSISRIEGGPVSMNINAPITREAAQIAQGKQPIQTPRGTIYATAEQAAAFGSRPTAYEGRTPEQQQALLAQMRTQGAKMAGAQERFFKEKQQERNMFSTAEEAARKYGFGSMDIMRAREAATGPSTIARIRSQATPYQAGPRQTFAQSSFNTFFNVLPEGASRSQQRVAVGSSNPYSNTRAQQRQSIRELARSAGIQPAYSLPIQQAQERYFRERGLM